MFRQSFFVLMAFCLFATSNAASLTSPSPKKSSMWRIAAHTTHSKWAWDVQNLAFFATKNATAKMIGAISSGSASDAKFGGVPGFEARNALVSNTRVWGGRPDSVTKMFWVGMEFDSEVAITKAVVTQPSPTHSAAHIELQYNSNGKWISIGEVDHASKTTSIMAHSPSKVQKVIHHSLFASAVFVFCVVCVLVAFAVIKQRRISQSQLNDRSGIVDQSQYDRLLSADALPEEIDGANSIEQ